MNVKVHNRHLKNARQYAIRTITYDAIGNR